jgi:citrate lyase beta subunit
VWACVKTNKALAATHTQDDDERALVLFARLANDLALVVGARSCAYSSWLVLVLVVVVAAAAANDDGRGRLPFG